MPISAPSPQLTTVVEAGRCIDQDDTRVRFSQESLRPVVVGSYYAFRMLGAVCGDVVQRLVNVRHNP